MTAAIIASKTIALGIVTAFAVAGAIVAGSPRAALVNNSMEQVYGSSCQHTRLCQDEDVATSQGNDIAPDQGKRA